MDNRGPAGSSSAPRLAPGRGATTAPAPGGVPRLGVVVRQLLALEPEIRAAWGAGAAESGRVDGAAGHVLGYFLHDLYRMAELIRLVQAQPGDSEILNVGIAYGFVDVVLRRHYGRRIGGLEMPESIERHCALCLREGIPVTAGRLGDRSWMPPAPRYDGVVFSEVFEHLRIGPLRALRQIHDVIRPGGWLILTTPNVARLGNIVRLALGRNVVEPLPDDGAGLSHVTDEMTHLREYTMGEVTSLVGRAGFVVEAARYSRGWDRYNRHLLRFRQAGAAARLGWALREAALLALPRFRQDLMVVARKPAAADAARRAA